MRDSLLETYLIIERTKQLDPEAFARHVDAHGMPGPFVVPDESRRLAAYQRACASVLKNSEMGNPSQVVVGHGSQL